MSRSIRVAPEHKQRVKVALRRHGFPSQKAFAEKLGISRSTTDKFFTGKPIDYSYFVEISERLGLDWQAIASIEDDPLPPPTDTPPEGESPKGIDWRQVCRDMLDAQNQRRLTTNPLTTGDGVAFELDEIYVPLGLVERKQRDKRSGDISPEQGSKVYEPEAQDEIIQTFQQDEFFEQVLRQGRSRRIAIIGEPGAGKTTLLQKIAAWVLDNTEDVPIWISLADLQGKSLEQYLLQDWLKAATRKVRVTEAMQEALGELFNSGRVWLLLDAVDEMVSSSGNALAQIANQLTGWVADAKAVLTCRLNVWDAGKNALEAFDTYRNLDFSYGDAQTSDQVGQFIRRWFKSKPELSDRLRAELDQPGRERIKDAVKNPLRLALLCRTWTLAQGRLPATKAGLYQQFTEALYEWKQDRFPTSSTQRQELNRALGELAKRAIASEKTKFRLRHRLVREVLGNPDADLFELALQLGWLNQVGVAVEAENWGEKVYAFYHPTFQEYLAAQAIDDWHYFLNHTPHNPAQGIYRIFEPSWKEVILLWLGREDVPHEQKEEFIKALVEFEDGCKDFYGYRAYFLAAVGIAEIGGCSRVSEIVAQIVKWGEIGTSNLTAIAALVQLIESTQDESTSWQEIDSLRTIQRDEQFARIVTALKDYLSDETYENDFQRFRNCYKFIWHYAQTMPYPAFYQAWYSQLTSTHPDVLESTGVDSNGIAQTLNLAELPQTLAATIANDPTLSQTIHLICIDGSKFIDRDNPAPKIYAEMVKAGCPKCEDSIPKTMQELQFYWDLLESEKRVVLVFYESTPPSPPLLRGGTHSERFLDGLSKFDGAIAIVTSPPAPLLQGEASKSGSPSSSQGDRSSYEGVGGWGSLQCFSSSQPQLIEAIARWIRAICSR